MTEEHEKHLTTVLATTVREISAKYRKGQEEHGGKLWCRPVWKDLHEEIIDAMVYSATLRIQLSCIADLALAGVADESVAAAKAREACSQILTILQGIPGGQDKQ